MPVASTTMAPVQNPGAKELFESAEIYRLGGRLRESAETLDKLRHIYRSDKRAGLAAFELGRLRMDSFGDLAGAVEAFNDAIRLSPNMSFREDAQARLVQLYDRQGNRAACGNSKADYLRRYPSGAASKVVNQLCEH